MNMTKFLEYIRSEKGNEIEGVQMDISKLLEFSGETPDGDGRPWHGSDD
jgi:hypothetical protein